MYGKSTFKLAQLAILISGLCSSCAISDYVSPHSSNKESIDVDLANQQIEQEKMAEDARISAEKQRQAEAKLTEIIGERDLQFKSAVAKIYADNEYALLWQDKDAEKKFLREYAAMVASGISVRSARSLEAISATNAGDNPVYDILLTDAFLDYMYYAKNVFNSAQNWLYTINGYKPAKPGETDVEEWLSAVKNGQNFAYVNSLTTNNSIYQQTIDKIGSSDFDDDKSVNSAILYKLALNAQRLRVIPNFSNGIFVNIPSYQLNYYRDNQLILNSRVIVGKKERRTPVMYSKLSNVVVNPPWNAPTRLINEDIVPKIKKNPGYLSAHGYSILDSKGNKVNPNSINWAAIGSKFPYRIRQDAGDNSALGRFKFNMPSSDAIYLHDTPNHNLFNKQDRALSSGCVRVEKSNQLASILLKEAGWSEDKKQRVLNSKKTTSAPIYSDNPVYLYYVTAWVENGQVNTLPDIYGYDIVQQPSYVNWHTVKKYL
ncbi:MULTISPECIES: L,D-transpeptidase family protein [Basfia]|uniref:L,D-TPase catalytic domain-containing protein n=1 Tax=Mannheimia succiniciproducens (strain KCTC 0769BP / MBEL55E) TaxID=221988 RepID=Q65UD1_MANSM|nr:MULTISPECIES: L,D-transpeptidase family protein [Basfia]AAU37429.1 unknown [[Mannheimia] succiniciproducens MBEL55E]SEQ69734.1 L,D-transpeptidase catalytic domain [Basfia succiniciproducens]